MTNFLTNKIGPLPAWGWGAGVAGILIVMKMSSAKKAKGPDPNDPSAAGGAPPASNAVMYGGSGNNYADGQTFGGGSLGMYSPPFYGGGNLLVNLFRHPRGDAWMHGGHHYPFHAFEHLPPLLGFGGDINITTGKGKHKKHEEIKFGGLFANP